MLSSISRSAVALGLVMLLLVAESGGIAYWGAVSSQDATSDLESVTVVVQRHIESDMKHDAIRGDVAAAIAALVPHLTLQPDVQLVFDAGDVRGRAPVAVFMLRAVLTK